jgi:hypothetical protein
MFGSINLSYVCKFLLVETLNLIRRPNERHKHFAIQTINFAYVFWAIYD